MVKQGIEQWSELSVQGQQQAWPQWALTEMEQAMEPARWRRHHGSRGAPRIFDEPQRLWFLSACPMPRPSCSSAMASAPGTLRAACKSVTFFLPPLLRFDLLCFALLSPNKTTSFHDFRKGYTQHIHSFSYSNHFHISSIAHFGSCQHAHASKLFLPFTKNGAKSISLSES